jgi:hypothetical protein
MLSLAIAMLVLLDGAASPLLTPQVGSVGLDEEDLVTRAAHVLGGWRAQYQPTPSDWNPNHGSDPTDHADTAAILSQASVSMASS